MRDHSKTPAVSTRRGTSKRPGSGSASGSDDTTNAHDLCIPHACSILSFSGTGSGDSHMLGSAETSQRLGCDASRVVMEHDAGGRIVDVGAKTRTIPPALRRALLHRDRRCRFPGCHGRFCQAHHIRHWAHGGPTTLSNLVLLCRRHHRAVHEEGYRVERRADGGLDFRGPHGRVVPDVPCPPRVPADPVAAVRTDNEESGIVVGPRTATPTWQGERLDVGYAMRCAPSARQRETERRVSGPRSAARSDLRLATLPARRDGAAVQQPLHLGLVEAGPAENRARLAAERRRHRARA